MFLLSGLVGYILVLHASRGQLKVRLKFFFVESITADEEKVQISVDRLTSETVFP